MCKETKKIVKGTILNYCTSSTVFSLSDSLFSKPDDLVDSMGLSDDIFGLLVDSEFLSLLNDFLVPRGFLLLFWKYLGLGCIGFLSGSKKQSKISSSSLSSVSFAFATCNYKINVNSMFKYFVMSYFIF